MQNPSTMSSAHRGHPRHMARLSYQPRSIRSFQFAKEFEGFQNRIQADNWRILNQTLPQQREMQNQRIDETVQLVEEFLSRSGESTTAYDYTVLTGQDERQQSNLKGRFPLEMQKQQKGHADGAVVKVLPDQTAGTHLPRGQGRMNYEKNAMVGMQSFKMMKQSPGSQVWPSLFSSPTSKSYQQQFNTNEANANDTRARKARMVENARAQGNFANQKEFLDSNHKLPPLMVKSRHSPPSRPGQPATLPVVKAATESQLLDGLQRIRDRAAPERAQAVTCPHCLKSLAAGALPSFTDPGPPPPPKTHAASVQTIETTSTQPAAVAPSFSTEAMLVDQIKKLMDQIHKLREMLSNMKAQQAALLGEKDKQIEKYRSYIEQVQHQSSMGLEVPEMAQVDGESWTAKGQAAEQDEGMQEAVKDYQREDDVEVALEEQAEKADGGPEQSEERGGKDLPQSQVPGGHGLPLDILATPPLLVGLDSYHEAEGQTVGDQRQEAEDAKKQASDQMQLKPEVGGGSLLASQPAHSQNGQGPPELAQMQENEGVAKVAAPADNQEQAVQNERHNEQEDKPAGGVEGAKSMLMAPGEGQKPTDIAQEELSKSNQVQNEENGTKSSLLGPALTQQQHLSGQEGQENRELHEQHPSKHAHDHAHHHEHHHGGPPAHAHSHKQGQVEHRHEHGEHAHCDHDRHDCQHLEFAQEAKTKSCTHGKQSHADLSKLLASVVTQKSSEEHQRQVFEALCTSKKGSGHAHCEDSAEMLLPFKTLASIFQDSKGRLTNRDIYQTLHTVDEPGGKHVSFEKFQKMVGRLIEARSKIAKECLKIILALLQLERSERERHDDARKVKQAHKLACKYDMFDDSAVHIRDLIAILTQEGANPCAEEIAAIVRQVDDGSGLIELPTFQAIIQALRSSKIKQKAKCALRVKNLVYKEPGQHSEEEVIKVHTTLRKLNILDAANVLRGELIVVIKLDEERHDYVKSSLNIINQLAKTDADLIDLDKFRQIVHLMQQECAKQLDVKCFQLLKDIVTEPSERPLDAKMTQAYELATCLMEQNGKTTLATTDLVSLVTKDQNSVHQLEIGRIIHSYDRDGWAHIDQSSFCEILRRLRQHQKKVAAWSCRLLEELVLSRKELEHDQERVKEAYAMLQKFKILDGSLVTEEDVLGIIAQDKTNKNLRTIKRTLRSLNPQGSLFIDESQFCLILQAIRDVRAKAVAECAALLQKLTAAEEEVDDEQLEQAHQMMCHLNVFDSSQVRTAELVEIMCHGKEPSSHKEIVQTIKDLDEDDDGQIDHYEFVQIVKYLNAHNKIAALMPRYQQAANKPKLVLQRAESLPVARIKEFKNEHIQIETKRARVRTARGKRCESVDRHSHAPGHAHEEHLSVDLQYAAGSGSGREQINQVAQILGEGAESGQGDNFSLMSAHSGHANDQYAERRSLNINYVETRINEVVKQKIAHQLSCRMRKQDVESQRVQFRQKQQEEFLLRLKGQIVRASSQEPRGPRREEAEQDGR